MADYVRRQDGSYEYRSTNSGSFTGLTSNNAVVFLFADRLDYTRADENDYENALAAGNITDYSEQLKGEGDVSVNINKSAEWADYYDRIAEVFFEINGTPKTEPLDILLVIDTSYSMDFSNYDWDYNNCSTDTSTSIEYGDYNRYDRFFEDQDAPNKLNGTSRMEDTKNAAYSFITTFMKNNDGKEENDKTRVAVVSFNDEAKIETGFTSDFDKAISSIEGLATNTGTNTGDALEKANTVLEDKRTDKKCIAIVLSDGAPNRPDTNFDQQLKRLQDLTDTLYTIGVDLDESSQIEIGKSYPGEGMTPKAFLEHIADDGCAYNMTSGENMVISCFQEIIEDLTTAAQDAVIHDIIGNYFSFNSSEDDNVYGNVNNDYVSINIGEVSAVGSTVSFKINLDESKHDLVDSYLTNQNDPKDQNDVYVSYKVNNSSDSTSVEDYPDVSVYKELVIEYYYEDTDGSLIPVKAGDSAYKKHFIDEQVNSLKGIEEYSSYERLTTEETKNGYEISETDRNAGLEYLSGYEFKRVESDLTLNDGTYQLENDNQKNVIKIVYGKSDNPYITVSKTFKGLSWKQIQELYDDFSLTVKNEDNTESVVLRLDDDSVTVTPPNQMDENLVQDYIFTWKMENCTTGTYIVIENGADLDGYQVITDGIGNSVKVEAGSWRFDPNVTLVTDNSSTSFTIGTNRIVMASLVGNNKGYLIWTNERLTSGQQAAVIDMINSKKDDFNTFNIGTATFQNCHFYCGDALRNGIHIGKGTITYTPPTPGSPEGTPGTLEFDGKQIWQHVLTGSYTMTNAVNADIGVINTYIANVKLDLKKISANSKALISGAKFELSKLNSGNWEVIQSNINVNNEENTPEELTNLIPGVTYKLEEKEAPNDFLLLGEPIYFRVEGNTVQLCDENGDTFSSGEMPNMWYLSNNGLVLTIMNNSAYVLPSAGGPGIFLYMIGGTLLLIAGSLMIYINRRRGVLRR